MFKLWMNETSAIGGVATQQARWLLIVVGTLLLQLANTSTGLAAPVPQPPADVVLGAATKPESGQNTGSSALYLPQLVWNYPTPSVPKTPTPADRAVNQSPNVFLAWHSVAHDQSALQFEVYLDPNDETPDTLVGVNPVPAFDPPTLAVDTQYFWRIVAVDGTGRRTAGPVWRFRTEAMPATVDTDAMVDVPAGHFLMGCDPANPSEVPCIYGLTHVNGPVRQVYLDGFSVDKYEVTNREYRTCVEAGACNPPRKTRSSKREHYYDRATYDNYPVIFVSWWDAQDFCAWEGKRLPTEAEWEKAARGPIDNRVWPWGNEAPDCDRLNFPELDGCTDTIVDTVRVGRYPRGASPYGAMDMSGNVFEWVNDMYDVLYYTYAPAANPPGPTFSRSTVDADPENQFDFPVFTIRGGSFRDNWFYRYVSHRHWGHWGDEPFTDIPLFRTDRVGFRCAQDLN